MKTNAPIPEFLKIASPDSCVSAKEIAGILGVTPSYIRILAKRGKFPMPDYKMRRPTPTFSPVPAIPIHYWRADTIRKFLSEAAK